MLQRTLARLPRPWRVAIDWIVTIAAAVGLVLAVKAWVVNPYRIPSSSMEPTLHCARPAPGCLARFSDRVLANRFIYRLRSPRRGEIIVFRAPAAAARAGCAERGDTFVKRLIGLPGERVREDARGAIWIDGRRLREPYVAQSRAGDGYRGRAWRVPAHEYFMVGDNRGDSCDSRAWGPVPRRNLIGDVFATYWPPGRISTNLLVAAGVVALLALVAAYVRRRRQPD
ncbi:MAG TPA: signal peptidase I [Gaiellaceae bacterium]|jgi:signal peptidase I